MPDFRPRTHTQRDAALHSVAAYAAGPEADPAIATLVGRLFDADREAFVAARAAYGRAAADAAAASEAADEADARFDAAFRRWARSVTDEDGRSLAAELAALVGGRRPSRVVKLPYAEEVAVARTLLAQTASRPRYAGDPAALVALQQATAALDRAVRQDADATRARLQAGVRLKAATIAFDRAYGRLRRSAQAVLSEAEVLRLLPRFARAAPDDEAGST